MATQTKNISEHQIAPLDANNVAYKTSNGQKHLTALVEDSQKHLKTVARRAYSGQKKSVRGKPDQVSVVVIIALIINAKIKD